MAASRVRVLLAACVSVSLCGVFASSSSAPANFMYFIVNDVVGNTTTNGSIVRMNLLSNASRTIHSEVSGLHGIDIHNGALYFATLDGPKIKRAALDGSGVTTLVDFSGQGYIGMYTVRATSTNLYWAAATWTGGAADMAYLDGSHMRSALADATGHGFYGIAVNSQNTMIYATDNRDDAQYLLIGQIDSEADPVKVSIVPSTSTLSGVDIDEVSKKLYLAGKNMPLLRCNTDGSNLEVVADLSKMDAYKVRVDSASGLLYMVLGRATIAVMTTDGEYFMDVIKLTNPKKEIGNFALNAE